MTDALIYLLDNIYIRFGSKLYRQNVGIPMGTNCAPLLLTCFCSAMRGTSSLTKKKPCSPKGNDAHPRAIIQSEKKWKHQFFRHLRAASSVVSVVGSGQISNSSKLLCMSSLPVSMKWIPSRTTEKKWQHLFSKYNTICCHGNQW